MDYINIKNGDDNREITITLTLSQVKILHNTCLDIIHEYEGMTGYENLRRELESIIKSNLNKQVCQVTQS